MQNPTEAPSPRVRVLSIKLIGKGSLLAVAEVLLGELVRVNQIKVIRDRYGNPWAAMPRTAYTATDGSTAYCPIVEVNKHTHDAISDAVLVAYGSASRGAQ